jgi:hypothetical protein
MTYWSTGTLGQIGGGLEVARSGQKCLVVIVVLELSGSGFVCLFACVHVGHFFYFKVSLGK